MSELEPQVMPESDADGDCEMVILEQGDRRLRWKHGSGSKAEEKARKTFSERLKAGWAAFRVKEKEPEDPDEKARTLSALVESKDKEIGALRGELIAIRALPERPSKVVMIPPQVGG